MRTLRVYECMPVKAWKMPLFHVKISSSKHRMRACDFSFCFRCFSVSYVHWSFYFLLQIISLSLCVSLSLSLPVCVPLPSFSTISNHISSSQSTVRWYVRPWIRFASFFEILALSFLGFSDAIPFSMSSSSFIVNCDRCWCLGCYCSRAIKNVHIETVR